MSSQKTILAIDDEIKALNLLKLTLEASGFNIDIESEGRYGIELARKKHFDLIILDIKMPNIDGWKICQDLKLFNETKDIPIILLSALSGDSIKRKATSLGVFKYITKPVDPDFLVETISTILYKSN
jgi:DNA-binding response OmpR family regulator